MAIWDLAGQRDAAQRRLSEARATIAQLQNHIDNDQVEIASLATQVSALEVESPMRAPTGGASAMKGRTWGNVCGSANRHARIRLSKWRDCCARSPTEAPR